ncbi:MULTISPECIES: hypothetical protein [Halomonas]
MSFLDQSDSFDDGAPGDDEEPLLTTYTEADLKRLNELDLQRETYR